MSSPEQKSFATTNESCATNVSILTGHLLAGGCALARLNFVAYRSMLDGSRQSGESVLSAQSPEQLARVQVGWLPSLATQMAAYITGWMDIASETSAKVGQLVLDSHAAIVARGTSRVQRWVPPQP